MSFAGTAIEFQLDSNGLFAAQLLAYYGINMLSVVALQNDSRIVVQNQLAGLARQILWVFGINHGIDRVRLFRFRSGVRGELNRVLSTNPSEIYLGEGNLVVAKYGGFPGSGGGIGILGVRGQGLMAQVNGALQNGANNLPSLAQVRQAQRGQFANLV